jgi:hypothetical protein
MPKRLNCLGVKNVEKRRGRRVSNVPNHRQTRLGLGQYDRPSIEKSGPVIPVEHRHRKIAEHLTLHVFWLNVHARGPWFSRREFVGRPH